VAKATEPQEFGELKFGQLKKKPPIFHQVKSEKCRINITPDENSPVKYKVAQRA